MTADEPNSVLSALRLSSTRARFDSGDPRHMAPPLPQAPLARGHSKNPSLVAAGWNALHSFSGVSHIPCSITITGFPVWGATRAFGPVSSEGAYTMAGRSSAPTFSHRPAELHPLGPHGERQSTCCEIRILPCAARAPSLDQSSDLSFRAHKACPTSSDHYPLQGCSLVCRAPASARYILFIARGARFVTTIERPRPPCPRP